MLNMDILGVSESKKTKNPVDARCKRSWKKSSEVRIYTLISVTNLPFKSYHLVKKIYRGAWTGSEGIKRNPLVFLQLFWLSFMFDSKHSPLFLEFIVSDLFSYFEGERRSIWRIDFWWSKGLLFCSLPCILVPILAENSTYFWCFEFHVSSNKTLISWRIIS